jgi:ABC-type amino acid transport system permease subunit
MKRTFEYRNTPLWVTIWGWVFGIIFVLGILFGVLCLESWLIMLLWNATLPVVFCGVTAIGFWQSVCINLLVILLFGGVGKIITAFIKKD